MLSFSYSPATASHLTAERLAANNKHSFSGLCLCNGRVYYAENSTGRNTIFSTTYQGQDRREELPFKYSAKTEINTYGGVAFIVTDKGVIFADNKTKAIYLTQGGSVRRLKEGCGWQYADFDYCPHQRSIVYVAEKATNSQLKQMIQKLCLETGAIEIIADTADFYHAPKICKEKITWLEWDVKYMPWQNGRIVEKVDGKIAIRAEGAAHFQPSYDRDGNLYYASDKTGYFNLYRSVKREIQAVYPAAIDFAHPLWCYGMRAFDFTKNGIVAAGAKKGNWALFHIETKKNGQVTEYNLPYVTFESLRASNETFAFIGGRKDHVKAVVCVHKGVKYTVATAGHLPIEKRYISSGIDLWFKNKHRQSVQAYYYPPVKLEERPPYLGDPPPLIVKAHGGPTRQVDQSFNPKIQFWTSRGFAVIDVNYSGSTGFGRSYRERLNGQWGLLEASELEAAARYCVKNGLVHADKIMVSGGSSGGFSVLSVLGHSKIFKAGCCLYGIADLASVRAKTHKFESRYFDSLIAPYPQYQELYQKRSPVFFAEKIQTPTLFLHGLDDQVVEAKQSQRMYEALKKNGTQTFLVNFMGESHGWRHPKVVEIAHRLELSFYAWILGYKLPKKEQYPLADTTQTLNPSLL